MPLNSKLCKILCEVVRLPASPNVDWNDVERLLTMLGSKVNRTKSGMRSDFGNGVIWISHRPHPKPLMDKGAVHDLRTHLQVARHPPAMYGCKCS